MNIKLPKHECPNGYRMLKGIPHIEVTCQSSILREQYWIPKVVFERQGGRLKPGNPVSPQALVYLLNERQFYYKYLERVAKSICPQ